MQMGIQLGGAMTIRYCGIHGESTRWTGVPGQSYQHFYANIIAESMYLQVDEDGNSYSLISEIVDHDGFEVTTYGRQWHQHTMRGWKLLVT